MVHHRSAATVNTGKNHFGLLNLVGQVVVKCNKYKSKCTAACSSSSNCQVRSLFVSGIIKAIVGLMEALVAQVQECADRKQLNSMQ